MAAQTKTQRDVGNGVSDGARHADDSRSTGRPREQQTSQTRLLSVDPIAYEARWRALVEDAPEHVLIVERDGIISFINHAVSPAGPEDVVGRSVFQLIPREFRERARRIIQSVFQSGQSVHDELIALGPPAAQTWFSNRVSPVKEGERVVAAAIVSRDVTRQKNVEEEARCHEQELAHVSRLNTMGEMATALAHELNQPLSAISNYAAGLALRLKAGDARREEMIKAAEDIGRQSRRAGDTIRRILDFVQKREVRHDRVNLHQVAVDAVELAAPQAHRHGVQIVVEAAGPLPDVMGDRIQIEQVLLNLLMNAVEAVQETPAAGRRVVVRTSRENRDFVQVCVCDRGQGLPEDYDDWIYEPFQSTKPRGTGLGLSISRSIVRAHHGVLWAVPNDDRGATFFASFPAWPGGEAHDI